MTSTHSSFASDRVSLASCSLESPNDHEAHRISERLASTDPWCRLNYSREALFRYLTGPDPALFRYAVRISGETAGVVGVRHPWLRGPYLELLAVFDPHRSVGIGREIIGWLEEESQRAGAKNIWVMVSAFNTRAKKFYESCGFVEAAVLPGLVARSFDEVLMRKVL